MIPKLFLAYVHRDSPFTRKTDMFFKTLFMKLPNTGSPPQSDRHFSSP